MIPKMLSLVVVGLLISLGLGSRALGQPELVSIRCDETIEEVASCSGPFIICERQYVIEVPEGATKLTVEIRPPASFQGGWDLDLFVNFGEPVDQNRLEETVIASAVEVGPDTIALSGAKLRPGTYYIAIGNPEVAPQPFELTVTVDPCVTCSENQQRLAQSAVRLPPNLEQTGSVQAASLSPTLAEPQYIIEVTQETQALAIGLRSLSGGDLNLHVQGGCAVDLSASPPDFSLVSPLGAEFIVLSRAQLKPGRYYLAVENRENTDQAFSIAAMTMPVLSGPFSNDGGEDGRVESPDEGLLAFLAQLLATSSGRLALTQYVLEVSRRVKALKIEIEGSGPLNLHLRFEQAVEISGGRVVADLSALGLSNAKAVLLSGALLQPGKYFLAIEGLTQEPQDFILRFTFITDQSPTTVIKSYSRAPLEEEPREEKIRW